MITVLLLTNPSQVLTPVGISCHILFAVLLPTKKCGLKSYSFKSSKIANAKDLTSYSVLERIATPVLVSGIKAMQ